MSIWDMGTEPDISCQSSMARSVLDLMAIGSGQCESEGTAGWLMAQS